jgi:branched-subunit amino acid aminotransferase/4-amino-4-deoxychorismate lyase
MVGTMGTTLIRVELDGQPVQASQLYHPAFVNYGHHTAMQVRGGRTRGLALHLHRLVSASDELFGTAPDPDRVLMHVRHALRDVADAAVRVIVQQPDPDAAPTVMVVVRSPVEPSVTPLSLRSVRYLRPVPHVKHLGAFGQIYHARQAELAGFDDALLTGPDGAVSETTIHNIAFFDGTGVVWPDAPSLAGVTMRLIEPRLPVVGLPSRRAAVHLADLPRYRAAFVTNSIGVTAVRRIDDVPFPVDESLMRALAAVAEALPWDAVAP